MQEELGVVHRVSTTKLFHSCSSQASTSIANNFFDKMLKIQLKSIFFKGLFMGTANKATCNSNQMRQTAGNMYPVLVDKECIMHDPSTDYQGL